MLCDEQDVRLEPDILAAPWSTKMHPPFDDVALPDSMVTRDKMAVPNCTEIMPPALAEHCMR